jgi:multiple sugar transport system permease protein
LLIALGVNRLKGWLQSAVLAAFFLPFILPVSVVYLIWNWVFDFQYGIAQYVLSPILGAPVPVFRAKDWVLPTVALITIWWTNGFSILLFLAGLRNIPHDLYEAAALDNANRWRQFWRITWPLIWPVTVLVLTIQLILQLKIFDQVYLFTLGGRVNQTMVLVQYIYQQAFVSNKGGYGATVALALFVIIVVFSILQFQLLRARGQK